MSLLESGTLGGKRFTWDETNNCLHLLGTAKQENERTENGYRQRMPISKMSQTYCPHAYLELTFSETLATSSQLTFRKYYLRKIKYNETDVIIIQDIKDLVMFLVIDALGVEFIRFFHVPVVDRFLRALIIYFQRYIEIWINLKQKRISLSRKAPNPRSFAYRLQQKNEMETLRSILAKEYCDMLMGADDTFPYHHMNSAKKSRNNEPSSPSQGEKDLRIYEILLRISHRVVWIALKRKHFDLIEVEMSRLFRTDAFNDVRRRDTNPITADMSDDEIRILHGEQMLTRRKFLRNSPLIYQIMNTTCDYRVLSLGIIRVKTQVSKIQYFEKALLANEEELPKLGIKVGILGDLRSKYDVMLHPNEEYFQKEENYMDIEKEEWDEQYDSSTIDLQLKSNCLFQVPEILRIPSSEDDPELFTQILTETVDESDRAHKIRADACKKWVGRSLECSANNFKDATSTAINE